MLFSDLFLTFNFSQASIDQKNDLIKILPKQIIFFGKTLAIDKIACLDKKLH